MIHLYGYLKDKYGSDHDIKVSSAVEVVRSLDANYKGFKNDIITDRYYSIVRGKDLNKGISVPEKELTMNFSDDDWHIIPLAIGAKSGLFQAVLGVVIIAVSWWNPMGWGLAAGATSGAWATGVGLGASMLLGGVSMMLTPNPEMGSYESREGAAARSSFLFQGATNKTEQGHGIPIAYGETFIGSIVISAGIDVGETV